MVILALVVALVVPSLPAWGGRVTTLDTDAHTAPPPGADSLDAGWLEALNFHREQAGLAPAEFVPDWQPPIEQHAEYMVINDEMTHYPDPDKEGYTEEGAQAAFESNISVRSSPREPAVAHIETWMESPFHGAGMMRPGLLRTAFGAFRDPDAEGWRGAAGLNTSRGHDRSVAPPDGYPVMWPGDGAVVPTVRAINEHFAGCPDDLPEGVPLRVFFDPDAEATLVDSHIERDGQALAHCAVDAITYEHADGDEQVSRRERMAREGLMLLTPEEPLEYGETYDVRIETSAGELAWSFDTRPAHEIEAHPEQSPWADDAAVTDVELASLDLAYETLSLNVAWDAASDGPPGYEPTGYQLLVDDEPALGAAPLDGAPSGEVVLRERFGDDVEVAVRVGRETGADVFIPHPETVTVPDAARVAGSQRFATAAALSKATFADGADVVYVATGQDFADALAGGVAAAVDNAPVLLSAHDSLPRDTAVELDRLAPDRIVVLGGQAAISEGVEAELATFAGTVERVAGGDRFATAAALSEATFTNADEVFVATGVDFADGLAGAPAAAQADGPLLLTATDRVPDSVRDELDRLDPDRVVVLGGTSAVTAKVERNLAAHGDVERISGTDRFDTAAQVADELNAPQAVYVATGADFADALTAGAVAGTRGAPVLLVTAREMPEVTGAALTRLAPSALTITGGRVAIDPDVAFDLVAAMFD